MIFFILFFAHGIYATQFLGQSDDSTNSLPEHFYIKTPTHGVNTNFEYALHQGKLYYRLREDRIESPILQWTKAGSMKQRGSIPKNAIAFPLGREWQLFQDLGLPHKEGEILTDQPLSYLWADADEVGVFNQAHQAHWLRERTDTKKWPLGIWNEYYGTPNIAKLILPPELKDHRGFALGRRNEEVKWFDDAQNFQHHWGTFNISTQYILGPDGKKIYYIDPGLPLDFRYQLCLPYRGKVELISLDASGAVVMVMDKKGNIYTRMEDFDTGGADSMLFSYSYTLNSKGQRAGTDPKSRWSTYHLEKKDNWQTHPIELNGQGKISKYISIMTTGPGNLGRELRVAGIGAEGEWGYYHKLIGEKVWKFQPANLRVNQGELFVPQMITSNDFSPINERSYSSELNWLGEKVKLEIINFNDVCVDSKLRLSLNGESYEYDLLQDPVYTRQALPTFKLPELPTVGFATIIPASRKKISNPVLKDLNDKVFSHLNSKTFGLEFARFKNQFWLKGRKNKKLDIKLQQLNPDQLSIVNWQTEEIKRFEDLVAGMKKDYFTAKAARLGLTPVSFLSKFRLMREMIPANLGWNYKANHWALEQLQ